MITVTLSCMLVRIGDTLLHVPPLKCTHSIRDHCLGLVLHEYAGLRADALLPRVSNRAFNGRRMRASIVKATSGPEDKGVAEYRTVSTVLHSAALHHLQHFPCNDYICIISKVTWFFFFQPRWQMSLGMVCFAWSFHNEVSHLLNGLQVVIGGNSGDHHNQLTWSSEVCQFKVLTSCSTSYGTRIFHGSQRITPTKSWNISISQWMDWHLGQAFMLFSLY